MTMLVFLVFGLGLSASAYAIWATVAPNLSRIGDALQSRERHFAPLETLVLAERRIAVRRWASAPSSAPVRVSAAA